MGGGKTALGLDTNVGALLCYLPVCLVSLVYSIIVLVSDKDNKTMRFHAFQSLLLTGLYIVLVIAISVIGGVIGAVVSGTLGSLFSLPSFVVIIAFLGAMIYGCIKGYQGEKFKFPIVGDMAEKWA